MQHKTLLWLAVATLLATPVALAQGLGIPAAAPVAAGSAAVASGVGSELSAAVATPDAQVQTVVQAADQTVAAAVDGTQVSVSAPALNGLPVNLLGPSEQAPDAQPGPASNDATRSRPWAQGVSAVTHEAGKAAGVVLLLTVVASFFEAGRAFLFKPFGAVGRKLLALPLLGAFSRIQHDDVLENAGRARIHEIIVQDPGLSLQDIQRRAGVAWGTAVHHVRRLEQHGLINSVREGPHRRFFESKTHPAPSIKGAAALFQPTARRIAQLVAERPGLNQARLCQELGVRNPAASKHLGHFESLGFVTATPVGRSKVYHPTLALRFALGTKPIDVQLQPLVRLQPVAATA